MQGMSGKKVGVSSFFLSTKWKMGVLRSSSRNNKLFLGFLRSSNPEDRRILPHFRRTRHFRRSRTPLSRPIFDLFFGVEDRRWGVVGYSLFGAEDRRLKMGGVLRSSAPKIEGKLLLLCVVCSYCTYINTNPFLKPEM